MLMGLLQIYFFWKVDLSFRNKSITAKKINNPNPKNPYIVIEKGISKIRGFYVNIVSIFLNPAAAGKLFQSIS